MAMALFTYATRRSALALAQSRAVMSRLSRADTEFRELQVVTTGDTIQDRPLAEVGGKGLFVKEIEEALLQHRADLAIHSMKDVPGTIPQGLTMACIPKREDARDVLVSPRYKTLAALPKGARVGTSSLRRAVSLRQHRPDLNVVPLRGNIDTRLRKVDAGECDAIVLARAGLARLGVESRIDEVLAAEVSLPAVAQGALGIECRAADVAARELVSALHDVEAAICVAAERGVLIAVGGDCKTPLAAHAERSEDLIHLRAFIAAPDGSRLRRAERRAPWPADEAAAHRLGLAVGNELAV
jgi:hydroxymethylbilane synthase